MTSGAGNNENHQGKAEEIPNASLFDVEKVAGRVKKTLIHKIGKLISKHPKEALSIIRGWMSNGK